jgi:hypothetical protein
VVAGRISDLDTQAYTEGTQLYLSPTTAGTFTSTKPYAPQHLVYVGIVVRAHPTQGVIEVKIQNGYELDELHNVAAQSPSNGDILQYVSATSLWTKVAGTTSNIAEGSNLYYTDARSRAALSFTAGSGAYNSTTGVITIPTNTNQLTNGANYITLGSLSASSPLSYNNGTGAFSISQANTSTNGFLSSTDWNTFNGKQAALNGTGFVKISGTTISYDNSTYYLASNPNAYIPLTALSAGAGISYNNTTGVITSTITQYTDANARAAISLTTSGTSGAATYNSTTGVLNVPQYAPDLSGYVPTSRTLTINGTAYDLSANRSWSVGTVTSVGLSSATSGVTIGSTPITTSGTITLAIATASGSQQGLLSSTDWTTFNNKQSALTNPVTGTGTTNFLPKFTGTSTIGNSQIFDNGTRVGIGTATNTTAILEVFGSSVQNGGNPGLRVSSSNTSQTVLSIVNSSSKTYELAVGGSSNVLGSGTFYIYDTTADAARLILSSSGNLGLGVTPSAWASGYTVLQVLNLSLFGTSGLDLNLASNTYYDGTSYKYIGNGFATMYNQFQGKHYWSTAGTSTAGNAISFTQAMTLNASGNLSIGNTNDTYKLDVTGTGRFSGNLRVQNVSSGRYFDFVTDSSASYLDVSHSLNVRVNGASSLTTALTIASTGAATFSSSVTTTGALSTFGQLRLEPSAFGSIVVGSRSSQTDFQLYNTGNIFRIYNGSSDALTVNTSGNVGIGTTSPTAGKLVVLSSDTTISMFGQNISSSTTLGDSFVTRFRNGFDGNGVYSLASFQVQNASGVDQIAFIGAQSVSGASNYQPNTVFGVRNGASTYTEYMRITSGGNVGIGTTSPSAPLTVAGNISLGNRASSGTSYIGKLREDNGGIANAYGIGFVNSDVNGAGYIEFYTSPVGGSGSTKMTLTGAGNLEIATGSIKTGEPDTGWGRAAIKIGASVSGAAFDVTRYLPVSVDGTVYYINLNSSTP